MTRRISYRHVHTHRAIAQYIDLLICKLDRFSTLRGSKGFTHFDTSTLEHNNHTRIRVSSDVYNTSILRLTSRDPAVISDQSNLRGSGSRYNSQLQRLLPINQIGLTFCICNRQRQRTIASNRIIIVCVLVSQTPQHLLKVCWTQADFRFNGTQSQN